MEAEGIIGLFLLGSLLFVMLFLVVGIINYFLQAIGLFQLAKRKGLDHAWIAWIPFFNVLVLTMLVEDDVVESLRGKYTLSYVIAFVASMFLSLFLAIFAVVPMVMVYYAFYLVAVKHSKKAMLHLIISIVTLGLTMPLQLFLFRKRKEITKIEVI